MGPLSKVESSGSVLRRIIRQRRLLLQLCASCVSQISYAHMRLCHLDGQVQLGPVAP